MTDLHQQRPLSPHLQVYKPQITSMMSISHRATGVALALGTMLLLAWLWALAYDQQYFNQINALADHWAVRFILVAWSFALFYHMGNGVRHLFWDFGKGFDLDNVSRSGAAVILFAAVMTAASWLYISGLLAI